ncbi:MAG: PadR family transcriptional regulator [Candidatus Geothermarchaeales archaeon]
MWCLCGPSDLSPVQFLVLLLLNRRPSHGYEVYKKIGEGFGSKWNLNTGGIYKTLSKLEKKGFIRQDHEEGGRTIYRVTEKGEKSLLGCLEWSARWMEFTKNSSPSCCNITFEFRIT